MHELLNEKYCFYYDNISQKDLFIQVGKLLQQDQIVSDNYTEALIDREKEYPTGFDLQEISVAIPHVAAEYIKKNGIWCAVVRSGCDWVNIEDETEQLSVNIVFGLLISDSNQQLELLQKITKIFRKIDVLKEISQLSTSKDIFQTLTKEFACIK